jgi:uncharacterized membrane protein
MAVCRDRCHGDDRKRYNSQYAVVYRGCSVWVMDISLGPARMYLIFKLLHVAAVIAFVGNITTGLFWHAHAARTRDPKLLSHALNGIILSDRLFTVPGVIGIVATGIAAAIYGGLPILRTGWILWAIVLFGVSGLIFMFNVAPLQRQLRSVAEAAAQSGNLDYARYRALAVRWELWGGAALLTPLVALALMVLKPSL